MNRRRSTEADKFWGITETQHQQALVKWWRYSHMGLGVRDEILLMSFPLQGIRSPKNGTRMRAEGMRSGTPDLLLAVPRGEYHGLWIEMKTHSGVVSLLQTGMLQVLTDQGFLAVVCRGFDDAKKQIEIYLSAGEAA